MTIQEQIKVMQWYADGGEVESLNGDNWGICTHPVWDWFEGKYRIKQEQPKTKEVFEWYYKPSYGADLYEISGYLMDEEKAKECFEECIFYAKTGRSFIVEDK